MRTIYTVAPARRLLLRYFNAYRQIFFYAALFLAGILGGALVLRSASGETSQSLSFLVGQFTQQRGVQTFSGTLLSSFTATALMLGVLFVCGFCAVAQPLIVLVPLFRGLGYGYQAGYIYAQNGFLGMGYTALILLPNIVFSTVLILFACSEAFEMSNACYRAARGGDSGSAVNLRTYCLRFILFFVLALAVAALDAVCTALFSGLFSIA